MQILDLSLHLQILLKEDKFMRSCTEMLKFKTQEGNQDNVLSNGSSKKWADSRLCHINTLVRNIVALSTLENMDPNNAENRFEKLYNEREKSATRLKEIYEKVMKEEGWSFKPKTNKKFNSTLPVEDVIGRNMDFIHRKNEKLDKLIQEKESEYNYMPNLISKRYNDPSLDSRSPVQERLYNKAMEIEMKKEEMRRNQVDANWTFKPKLAKMTDQILVSRSIFGHH